MALYHQAFLELSRFNSARPQRLARTLYCAVCHSLQSGSADDRLILRTRQAYKHNAGFLWVQIAIVSTARTLLFNNQRVSRIDNIEHRSDAAIARVASSQDQHQQTNRATAP